MTLCYLVAVSDFNKDKKQRLDSKVWCERYVVNLKWKFQRASWIFKKGFFDSIFSMNRILKPSNQWDLKPDGNERQKSSQWIWLALKMRSDINMKLTFLRNLMIKREQEVFASFSKEYSLITIHHLHGEEYIC